MNAFPLFVWFSFTHVERSRLIFLLLFVSSVACVGAVLASVVSVNATVTFTLFPSQAVPFASFTKSRPVDNVS